MSTQQAGERQAAVCGGDAVLHLVAWCMSDHVRPPPPPAVTTFSVRPCFCARHTTARPRPSVRPSVCVCLTCPRPAADTITVRFINGGAEAVTLHWVHYDGGENTIEMCGEGVAGGMHLVGGSELYLVARRRAHRPPHPSVRE